MIEPDNVEVFKKAWKLWGKEAQLDMLIEEASEVIHAVCKLKRNNYAEHSKIHLTEEIADFLIVAAQYVQEMNQRVILDNIHAEDMENLREKVEKYEKEIEAKKKEETIVF